MRLQHIESDIVDHVDVTAVVDESPAGTIDNGAALDHRRIAIVREAIAMEVNRIAAARVGARAGLQHPIAADDRIVDHLQLVGPAQSVESSIGDIHIAVVHEHDVAAAIADRAFRFEKPRFCVVLATCTSKLAAGAAWRTTAAGRVGPCCLGSRELGGLRFARCRSPCWL